MKSWLLILSFSLSFLAPVSYVSGADISENPLLRLLHFVPDTPTYREYLTYGNTAAWYNSWKIPRIDSVHEFNQLNRDANALRWLSILSEQTLPPDALGFQYLFQEDQRRFYGFDLFNLDRFIGAGMSPPEGVTIAEFHFDQSQIAKALTASGYTEDALTTGGTLYSILDDYQLFLDCPIHTGQLGNLNRIALLNGQLVIAKATDLVLNALQAHSGEQPSLAENPDYLAAVMALEHPALKNTGDLVGVVFMGAPNMFAPAWFLEANEDDDIRQLLQEYAQETPLPPYSLVAFATRHAQGASFLILTMVFPKDTDAHIAADVLADRLQHYRSLKLGIPLADRWTFEKAIAVEVQGLPVTLAIMRVDDPSPPLQDTPLSWHFLIVVQDLAFLIPAQTSELSGK